MTIPDTVKDRCTCSATVHQPKFIVLTGGPSAGKSRLLQMIRNSFCPHVGMLPEAASIVFGGGFPRMETPAAKRAAQRTIYHVQDQLEEWVRDEGRLGIALCDRGTLDGLAYWPDSEDDFFGQLGTTRQRELTRYAAVIHLHTPGAEAYDSSNRLRIESAGDAVALDARVESVWRGHSHRFFVNSTTAFEMKVAAALAIIREELPLCCREHVGTAAVAAGCTHSSKAAP